MNRKVTLLRKKLLFLLIPVFVGTAYIGSTVLPSSANKKDKSVVRVNNLTRSCELLNVEKHKDHIQVSVQNNSNKAITAYVITSRIDPRTVFTFKEDYAFTEGDNAILPGQRHDRAIGVPASLNRQAEINLNFSAVIFEDNSSEGDAKIIHNIEDYRLGEKVQLMKALPVLERLSRLPDKEISAYWNKSARYDFETALNEPDAQFLIQLNKNRPKNNGASEESEQFEIGVQGGKDSVTQKYQELNDILEKQGPGALRNEIIYLRDLYAGIMDKL